MQTIRNALSMVCKVSKYRGWANYDFSGVGGGYGNVVSDWPSLFFSLS